MFFVEIVNTNTEAIVKRMGPMKERDAERVFAGASINLNHDDYFLRIVEA